MGERIWGSPTYNSGQVNAFDKILFTFLMKYLRRQLKAHRTYTLLGRPWYIMLNHLFFRSSASRTHRLLSTNYQSQHPPILFDLILQSDWAAAKKRVTNHPHEARYKHPRGYTMLHCTVESGAPIEFVEAMVNAFPQGVEMKDWKGRTVLDMCLYQETKEFLNKYSNTDSTSEGADEDAAANSSSSQMYDDKLYIIQQIHKISDEATSLEASCQRLRKEIDVLIAKMKHI